jgi:acyl-coenzyme A synthetase/AMP-(fatty) acid ligase
MNDTFLIDEKNEKVSYTLLLLHLQETKQIQPFLKAPDLLTFYTRLIAALATNQNITLLDSDLSQSEITKLTGSENAYLENVDIILSFRNLDHLIELVLHSTSTISLYTSGTTGQPKKISHRVSGLIGSAKVSERFSTNVWGLAYNPSHMAGLQVFFQSFLNRNCLVYLFQSSRERIVKAIIQFGVTHISATPTYYRLLAPFDFVIPQVLKVTVGGEKSNVELYQQIAKVFPNGDITNIYASTEAGKLFSSKGDMFSITEELKEKIKIVNGELVIHHSLMGENSFSQDEWYSTGDLVEVVTESPTTFKFKSRVTEILNVGGYNVNPHEVESCINLYPNISTSRVLTKPNSVLGNILMAEIEATEAIDEARLRQHLSNHLQIYKIPRIIKVVKSIDKTRSGKVKRS